MKISFSLVFIFSLLFIPASEAAVYKGQKSYVKKCRKCHGGGQQLAASKSMKEWKTILGKKDKGSVLAKIHLDNEEAKKSHSYFGDKKYVKDSKHLRDFMVEYAKDSGNVPACN